MKWQLSLSTKAGGTGLRAPEFYHPATRISALTIPEETIDNHFNFNSLQPFNRFAENGKKNFRRKRMRWETAFKINKIKKKNSFILMMQ